MGGYTIGYSKRPLLVAGHGIRLSGAQAELMRVLDLGYPAVTTFNGFDLIPSDHPSFMGRIGTLGTHEGNNALRTCDLLICVGTRNNLRQVSFNWKSFAPQAAKIIVDIDMKELLKPTVQGALAHINAKSFLESIKPMDIDKDWLGFLNSYKAEDNPTKPYKFMRDLTGVLNDGAVVVCGNGTACVCMFQAGIVKNNQRFIWNSGCAAMGYDLPASIGAYYASGKEVICITGDGSIQMNIQELQTIKHYNIPIKIFVLNNDGYRSIEMTQTNYFNADFIGCNKESGVSFPSLRKVADCYDMKYFYISDWDKKDLEDILSYPDSFICEVNIGKNYIFNPKFTRSL